MKNNASKIVNAALLPYLLEWYEARKGKYYVRNFGRATVYYGEKTHKKIVQTTTDKRFVEMSSRLLTEWGNDKKYRSKMTA